MQTLRRRFFVALFIVGCSIGVQAQNSFSGLPDDALQYMRGYLASLENGVRRDVLFIEGPSGELYFPITELADLLDSEAVLALSQNVRGCSPCIPLLEVAVVDFDESANRVNLKIKPEYLPAQTITQIRPGDEQAPLQFGGGLAASFALLGRYEERTDEEQYALDTDVGVSMGRLGNLYTSVIHFKDGDTIRGQSFYEYNSEKSLLTFQLGDVTTRVESFGSSVQLGGFKLRRAFETSPEYNYRPFFKYLTEARLPGTLELFIDGQRIKQEEYKAGQISVENGLARRGDELTLVLTDSIGNRRVIRQSLFDVSNNLAPGVVDFDLSYGSIREGENDYSGEYGSAWGSVGITNHWTQSLAYEGNKEFEQASTELILSFGGHVLNVQGAWSNLPQRNEEGSAMTAQYVYDWGGVRNWARFGVEYFEAERFGRFRNSSLSGTGTTVSFSAGVDRFYGGVSAFEIGDFTGGSLSFGFGGVSWYVEASAEYLETDDYMAVFTLGYRPQGRYKPRIRAVHGWERDNRSVGADVSGSLPVGNDTLGYQVAAAQDYDRTETVDSRAGIFYRGNRVDVQANYSDVGSLDRSSARVTTGFVIAGSDAFLTSRPVGQAFVTAVTNQPGVRISGGGYSRDTDGDGEASMPLPSYYESQIKIDRESLNRSDVLTYRTVPVRVAKGNYASVDMPVTQAPMIIHILNNGVNDIFINGHPFVHNDFGAYVNKYLPDEINTLEVGGKRYKLVLPLVLDELPIYEFDRESGKLIRISELFRENR